jgi:hypothetical protein
MPIPSQAQKREGVEIRRAAPKAKAMVKGESRPQTERVVKTIVVRKSLGNYTPVWVRLPLRPFKKEFYGIGSKETRCIR